MEVTRPCVTCGEFRLYIDRLDLGDTANWFVKCENCVSVTTITHAVREDAIKQWDDQFCWRELDTAKKRAEEAKDKESHLRRIQNEDIRVLRYRYETVLNEYVKYRMLYSGTAGNISLDERRNLMKKEVSAELGWTI